MSRERTLFNMDASNPRDARMQQRIRTFIVALVFRSFASLICCQPAESAGLVRGYMDDLIGRIGAMIGVDRTAAEKAVGIIPQSARSWARCSVLASSSDV
jgi:hypothetical protein